MKVRGIKIGDELPGLAPVPETFDHQVAHVLQRLALVELDVFLVRPEDFVRPLEHSNEKRVLAFKIMVNQVLADHASCGDLVDAGAVEAAAGELFGGDVQDGAPPPHGSPPGMPW